MLHYYAQIRRLRIAQMVRNRAKESDVQTHDRNHQFRSAIPLLPPLTRASLRSACSPLFTRIVYIVYMIPCLSSLRSVHVALWCRCCLDASLWRLHRTYC
jgi:hypothetical protein